MTRSSRRRLFYALLALFFVLGAGVVLYAQGWRFDFAIGRFDKVGAIYLRTFPADAAILLNGKPVQSQVGFLTRGTLIGDLFPKTYQLKLTAAGYDDWHESVSVLPSLVTELKNAVLVPRNATSVAAASGIFTTFLATQKELAAVNANDTAVAMVAMTTAMPSSTLIKKSAQKIVLVRNGLLGILQTDGSLSLYDTSSRDLHKLAAGVQDFFPSADGAMIATLERTSIEIFSLNNPNDPSGYYRFNLPNIGGIQRLIWYKDQSHLFVVYKNSPNNFIAFLDFADVGLNNFTTVAHGIAVTGVSSADASPAYDPQTNALYVTTSKQQVVLFAFPQ